MSPRNQVRLTRVVWIIVSTGAIAAWSALYLIRKNDPNGIVILDQLGPDYRAYWIWPSRVSCCCSSQFYCGGAFSCVGSN